MDRRAVLEAGLALGTVGLAGCAGPEPGVRTTESGPSKTEVDPSRTTGTTDSPAYRVEPVSTGFTRPWGLAFVPEQSALLVTERPGRLRLLDAENGTSTVLSGTPSVYSSGQGGLLDVTTGRAESEPWVYLTYAATNRAGASATHLGRGRLDLDAGRLREFERLHVAEPFAESNAHYGSRVVIGPDDMLYVSVGDRQFKNFGPDHVAQDPTTELGTTLRLAPDGRVPDDNPFVGESGKLDTIYSYGHRNVQAMAVHPGTGAIWQAEHGERDGDEINVIEAGGNYGWPVASYACHYGSDQPVGDPPDERPEFVEPVYHWECGSGGFPPSGMAFYDGDAFPEWQGDLFVGTLAGQYLGRFTVDGRTVTENPPLLADRGWRIRDVAVAPTTGELYVAVDRSTPQIVRLVPA
jgi:glucose/arabinose dehydrogenase